MITHGCKVRACASLGYSWSHEAKAGAGRVMGGEGFDQLPKTPRRTRVPCGWLHIRMQSRRARRRRRSPRTTAGKRRVEGRRLDRQNGTRGIRIVEIRRSRDPNILWIAAPEPRFLRIIGFFHATARRAPLKTDPRSRGMPFAAQRTRFPSPHCATDVRTTREGGHSLARIHPRPTSPHAHLKEEATRNK
jgi:hypothetical protein